MGDGQNRLTAALREVAREDAERAPKAPDERLAAELRAVASTRHQRTQHPAPGTWHSSTQQSNARAFGYALAATLAVAIGSSLWLAGRLPVRERASAPKNEITSAFMPLTYSALPYTEAHLVRLEVPRDALKNFGLAPADVPADATPAVSRNTVLADVLVGEDGLARAVRFVRAERAPGVAP